MSTESTRPPPFYCPACGKKHRADLTALEGMASAVARVDCARCEAVMSLRIGDDGLPKCEILEQPAKEATAETVVAASAGGAMSKSSTPLTLVLAAVVAAAVSFGVGRLTAGEGGASAAPADDRVAALERQLTVLAEDLKDAQAKADAAQALATTAHAGVRAVTGSTQQGMQANTYKVTAIETTQSALGGAFEELKGKWQDLNGRIESNYTDVRKLTKRVKTLEAK